MPFRDLRSFVTIVVALIVFVTSSGGTALAQGDDAFPDDEYESPTFQTGITWNDSWEVAGDAWSDPETGSDHLKINLAGEASGQVRFTIMENEFEAVEDAVTALDREYQDRTFEWKHSHASSETAAGLLVYRVDVPNPVAIYRELLLPANNRDPLVRIELETTLVSFDSSTLEDALAGVEVDGRSVVSAMATRDLIEQLTGLAQADTDGELPDIYGTEYPGFSDDGQWQSPQFDQSVQWNGDWELNGDEGRPITSNEDGEKILFGMPESDAWLSISLFANDRNTTVEDLENSPGLLSPEYEILATKTQASSYAYAFRLGDFVGINETSVTDDFLMLKLVFMPLGEFDSGTYISAIADVLIDDEPCFTVFSNGDIEDAIDEVS